MRGFFCESQTICALLVKDHTVVALCPVGLYDIRSSNMSVCVGFPLTVIPKVLFSRVTNQYKKGSPRSRW